MSPRRREWEMQDATGPVHVIPVDDLREHAETGTRCWCQPRVGKVEGGELLVVHNSMDGRELIERHGVN